MAIALADPLFHKRVIENKRRKKAIRLNGELNENYSGVICNAYK